MAKTGAQEFTQSWAKTQQWAHSKGIPNSALQPVYQLDAQKLMSGYPMSEAERVRAIEASAGLNYSSALPTDAQDPTNIIGNTKGNLSSLFTSVTSGGLISNILDTLGNAITHPSSWYGIFLTKHAGFNSQELAQNMNEHVLQPHDILSWIPGLADVAEAFQGKAGLKSLADNPVTSLLDVLGVGEAFRLTDRVGITDNMAGKSIVGDTIANTPKGAAMAEKLGVTTDELSKMGPAKVSFNLLKTLKFPGGKHPGIVTDAAGQVIDVKPMTIGDRIKAFRNTHSAGSDQGDILQAAAFKSEEGTREVERIAGPAAEALGKITPEQYTQVMKIVQSDHRAPEEVLSDDSIPPPVRSALSEVYKWGQNQLQIKMQAGDMVPIETPYGTEYYTTRPGSSGPIVQRALDVSKSAQALLDQTAKPLDALIYKVQTMDNKMSGAFDMLAQNVAALYDAIKKSIPELSDDAQAQHLRSTLPESERWDRAVPEQTPLLRNLLGLKQDERLTLHHVNAIKTLFAPGGLLDTMAKDYNDQNWVGLSKASRIAIRKFANKTFSEIPTDGARVLNKMKNLTKNIHDYAVQREKDTNAMDRLWNGTRHGEKVTSKTARSKSIQALSRKAADAHQAFVKKAIQNPPDIWRDTYLDLLTNQILNSEKSAELIDKATTQLKSEGFEDSQLEILRQDPRTIIELFTRSAKASLENSMLPSIDYGDAARMSKDALNELSSLRARGHTPAYIPTLSAADIREGIEPTYNVSIKRLKLGSVASTFKRAFDYTPSVYDIQLAILKDTKDQITHDSIESFLSEDIQPHLYNAAELQATLRNYLKSEIVENAARTIETGVRHATADSSIEKQIQKMGLRKFDPSAFGATTSMGRLNADYYVSGDLMDGVEKALDKFTMPAQSIYERGTKVFRYSILGLSPRYFAHILFGGTYLIGLRGHVSMLTHLREGVHIARTGVPSDLSKFPHAALAIGHNAVQEGQEDVIFHQMAGYKAGNMMINEFMDNHQMVHNVANKLKAAANVNYTMTRFIVRAQKAVVYLDGAARAEKSGSFYDDDLVQALDEHGQPKLNPATGKPIMKWERSSHSMTAEQAHEAGMDAVSEVMGELRHMTPLERVYLTKAFPFYGWTKHILTYVMTYPADHPRRAQFLSQLAQQNAQDTPSGLPLRIQLLFFLGQPDAQGNVTALNAAALNPLRDTGNYASLSGLFQSLNPVLAAPIAYVDPQISYGGNELYPNVTYSSLYGVNEAGPQGSPWQTVEQFVPEVSTLDQAFNLSGQYAYLKTQGGAAFGKKLASDLNIPFYPEHINVRQIAAKDEIDRYNDAKNIATEALQTGDFSEVDKIPGTVPDPLNPAYNVTAAYLKALYDHTQGTGVSPLSAYLAPKTPTL